MHAEARVTAIGTKTPARAQSDWRPLTHPPAECGNDHSDHRAARTAFDAVPGFRNQPGLAYSLWRKKPIVPILITSIFANLLTQSFLWIALSIFFQHYLTILLIAEILVWIIESALYYSLRFNQLSVRESLFLSLIMNLSSFAFGLFLPV